MYDKFIKICCLHNSICFLWGLRGWHKGNTFFILLALPPCLQAVSHAYLLFVGCQSFQDSGCYPAGWCVSQTQIPTAVHSYMGRRRRGELESQEQSPSLSLSVYSKQNNHLAPVVVASDSSSEGANCLAPFSCGLVMSQIQGLPPVSGSWTRCWCHKNGPVGSLMDSLVYLYGTDGEGREGMPAWKVAKGASYQAVPHAVCDGPLWQDVSLLFIKFCLLLSFLFILFLFASVFKSINSFLFGMVLFSAHSCLFFVSFSLCSSLLLAIFSLSVSICQRAHGGLSESWSMCSLALSCDSPPILIGKAF